MSETFTPLAQSRASYYCKGSPVHFDMVELFRMESTGSTVVTLTFKNLYTRPVRTFVAHFRCKDRQGAVLGEDDFTYEDVGAGEGESFGSDDAVFVCDDALGSVEVNLVAVTYDDGLLHSLRRCPPVALPRLRTLPLSERAAVRAALGNPHIDYYPEEAADGWRCGCGAFNYSAGKAKYTCSDCGADRALLAAAVRDAERASAPQRPAFDAGTQFLPVQDDAPARPASAGPGHGR